MTAFNFDVFESKALSTEKIEAGLDKIKAFNSFFHSEVKPSGGIYGVAETLKDNGILERISRINSHILPRFTGKYFKRNY